MKNYNHNNNIASHVVFIHLFVMLETIELQDEIKLRLITQLSYNVSGTKFDSFWIQTTKISSPYKNAIMLTQPVFIESNLIFLGIN